MNRRELNYEAIMQPGKKINPESQFAEPLSTSEWIDLFNEMAGRAIISNVEGVDDMDAPISYAEFAYHLNSTSMVVENMADIGDVQKHIESDLYKESD